MTAEEFPFAYVGGGWYREKGVRRGTVAEIIHGDHLVELVFALAQHRAGCMRVFYRDPEKACTCKPPARSTS